MFMFFIFLFSFLSVQFIFYFCFPPQRFEFLSWLFGRSRKGAIGCSSIFSRPLSRVVLLLFGLVRGAAVEAAADAAGRSAAGAAAAAAGSACCSGLAQQGSLRNFHNLDVFHVLDSLFHLFVLPFVFV
jgi:hypothetical protein